MTDPVKKSFDDTQKLVEQIGQLPAGDQPQLLTEVEAEYPGAAKIAQCYTDAATQSACLEKVKQGWGGTAAPAPVSPKAGATKGEQVAQEFMNWLAAKKITLQGNPEADRKTVEENLPKFKEEYVKAHPGAEGLDEAEEAIRRFFDTWESTPLMQYITIRSKVIGPTIEKWLGFVVAGAVNGINLFNLLPIDLQTDNAFLANPVVKAMLQIDFAGMNKDLSGPIQFKQAAFGMMGQIYSTSLLDGWIDGLDAADKWKARLVLFLFAGVGAAQSNALQSDILDTQFAEDFMPNLRSTVENLVKYLLAHPDMGYMTDLHRQMKPVSNTPGLHPMGLLRSGMAVLIFMNAKNNARFQIQGTVDDEMIGKPEDHKKGNQSITFEKTFSGMAKDYQAKGHAMNMNNALFLADIFLATFRDALDQFKLTQEAPNFIQYATPLASSLASLALLRMFISAPLKENPAKALGADSIPAYLANFQVHREPDDIKKTADGAVESVNEAFLYGSLQGLLAGITDHPRETVDAFMAINNMAASTNLTLEHGAAESKVAIDAVNVGIADKDKSVGYAVTQTMGTLKVLGLVSSALAGFEAGKTAALARGNYLETLPALYGLAIRVGLVMDAQNLPEGAAKEDVVNNQYLNLGVYTGLTLGIFGLHRFFKPVNMDFKFEGASYRVAGSVGLSLNGIALKGTFGSKNTEVQSGHDQLMTRLQDAQKRKDKVEIAQLEVDLLKDQMDQVQEALRRGNTPLNTTDKTQTQLIRNELLAPLLARKEQINTSMVQLARQTPVTLPQPSSGSIRSAVFRPSVMAMDEKTSSALAQLESEKTKVDYEISKIENTHDLAGLYKEKTGMDLRLNGFNPVLQKYARTLAFELAVKTQMAQLYKVLAEKNPV